MTRAAQEAVQQNFNNESKIFKPLKSLNKVLIYINKLQNIIIHTKYSNKLGQIQGLLERSDSLMLVICLG